MTSELSVEERILRLLEHLGVARAHVGAHMSRDWSGLVSRHPEAVASLTLICPFGMKADVLRARTSSLLVVAGDSGGTVEEIQRAVQELPGAQLLHLRDYYSPMWADVLADRREEVGSGMMEFLARHDHAASPGSVTLAEGEGEVAGILYRVSGSGPPLLLFPLGLAPSQWEPLVSLLSRHYCTITLGGPALGMAAFLEARALGYLRVVRGVVSEMALEPGQRLLEVGCGAGTVSRWLARYTGTKNPIVGVDVNSYLLREAANLAKKEGVQDVIEWRNGNGENLPLADNEFDAAMAFTVMEEGNADRMLSECVRVIRPGGKVAVIVRSLDMPWWVNLPLRGALKRKVEGHRGDVVKGGCADASLYPRMRRAGLKEVVMLPQWATFAEGERLQDQQERMAGGLEAEEIREWEAAVADAMREGTFFISQPFHCAVGVKP